ncbi:hypothetical protein I8748_19955 [Nostoc sp. CENA67]|uniref:Uncharacterized protein n=1 Tax=Amazonocrinis nigriterrae CENA67 TaxID=2794033 RepID=A0A8J7L9H3_9NOST|nr:hypothetical protein [Amazonocrinis nigriterrae]MBH8564428.1 hypothetical protein [Amazonocrinis nigriterrae CENA67]
MTKEFNVNDLMEPIQSAPHQVKKIIELVLQAEKDKLSQEKPQVKSDIIKIIKEVVNEATIDSAM